jgi:ATP-dependent Clp protease adaptor protein ClpS
MVIFFKNYFKRMLSTFLFSVQGQHLDTKNFAPILKMMSTAGPEHESSGESGVAVAPDIKTKLPKKYKVLLHNDDYTTMEFVVHVLEKFFQKSVLEANTIMMEVHVKGVGICGIYTYEVAESKANKVNKYSRDNGHPLKCTISPE